MKLILLVEDNESIVFNVQMMLEFNGFEVMVALNGKEALNLMKKAECLPDLILSDIMMPEMDGWEFHESLQGFPAFKKIPFVFFSARSDPEEVKRGLELGADDYITKPFTEEELIERINQKLAEARN